MKRTLFIGMLGLSALMSGYAQQGEGVRKGRIVREPLVHDPVMAKEGDTYYLYSTGHNVSSFSSKDLSEWTIRHSVFSAPPQWAVDSIKGYEGHTWAPDIIYYKGNYHLFYSCSAFGKNTSAIGHAYRRTLSSASDEPWTDTGAVIVSHARDNFNAIDPNIVVDEKGDPWMAFGSFWGGIQLVRLTEDLTSTLKPEKLYTICTRQFEGASDVPSRSVNSVEAPFIFKHGDYYYLFVSYDFCCRGLKSDYKVVVGRSTRVTGPYVDKDGRELTRGGGSLVVDSNYSSVNDYTAMPEIPIKDGAFSGLSTYVPPEALQLVQSGYDMLMMRFFTSLKWYRDAGFWRVPLYNIFEQDAEE